MGVLAHRSGLDGELAKEMGGRKTRGMVFSSGLFEDINEKFSLLPELSSFTSGVTEFVSISYCKLPSNT